MRVRTQSGAEWRAIYTQFLASPAWDAKRALVLARAGGRCEACLRAAATEIHHTSYPRPLTIIPLAKGGAHTVANLCVACAPCNRRKNAQMPDVFSGQAELEFAA